MVQSSLACTNWDIFSLNSVAVITDYIRFCIKTNPVKLGNYPNSEPCITPQIKLSLKENHTALTLREWAANCKTRFLKQHWDLRTKQSMNLAAWTSNKLSRWWKLWLDANPNTVYRHQPTQNFSPLNWNVTLHITTTTTTAVEKKELWYQHWQKQHMFLRKLSAGLSLSLEQQPGVSPCCLAAAQK